MIIVMRQEASAKEIAEFVRVKSRGFRVNISRGEERTIIGVIGDERPSRDGAQFEVMNGVEGRYRPQAVRAWPRARCTPPTRSSRSTASRSRRPHRRHRRALFGGEPPAGTKSAFAVKEAGAVALRGGAFKPRSSPYSFQGMGEKGLELLAEAREATGCPSSPRPCRLSRSASWPATPT